MEMCVCDKKTDSSNLSTVKQRRQVPSIQLSEWKFLNIQKFDQRPPDCDRSLSLTPCAYSPRFGCAKAVFHMPGSRIHLWPPKVTSWDLLKTVSVSMLFETVSPVASSMPQGFCQETCGYQPAIPCPHLVLHTRLVRAAFPHPIWHYLGKTNNSCQWTADGGPFCHTWPVHVISWDWRPIFVRKIDAEYLCKLALLLARCTRSHQKAQGCKWFPLCSCTCLPLWRTRMFLALHLKLGNCHAKLADSRSAVGSSMVVMVVNIVIHFLCIDH